MRHFVTTVYLFHEGKTLLHRHLKLGKWLPPGGHVEPNETPPEAAIREVREETGLEITFLEQENLIIQAYNATSFPRPFLCLLENIPAFQEKPAHQHMDMIYLAKPKEGFVLKKEYGFSWFGWEDLEKMQEELFPDVRFLLQLLLKENGLARTFTNGGDAVLV